MAADRNDLVEFMVWLEHNYAIGFTGDDMLNLPRLYLTSKPDPYEMPIAPNPVPPSRFVHQVEKQVHIGGTKYMYVCSCGMYFSDTAVLRQHTLMANGKM